MKKTTDQDLTGHRVFALVTDAFGGYGGIAQYNRDLLKTLAACEITKEVFILPRLGPNETERLPCNVTQLLPRPNRFIYSLYAILFALRLRPTIVFCGHLYHGQLAKFVSRLVGAKLVSQVHGTEIWGDVKTSHVQALEAADMVLTVSRDTRARVLSKTIHEPTKVLVLNNTVGANFSPGDRKAARLRYGLNDEFVILTVSRLDSREGYKGHDKIIDLLPRMSAGDRPLVYLVAGVGDDLERLQTLSQRLGVAKQVHFLGKVQSQDLPDLYRAADLFALPSTGEGFGIAFLEAMACGTPALGIAIGGAPDALGDGELGWCVDEKNLDSAFAYAIAANGEIRRDLFQAVQTRFGLEVFGRRVTQLFALMN